MSEPSLTVRDQRRIRGVILEWLSEWSDPANEIFDDTPQMISKKIAANLMSTIEQGDAFRDRPSKHHRRRRDFRVRGVDGRWIGEGLKDGVWVEFLSSTNWRAAYDSVDRAARWSTAPPQCDAWCDPQTGVHSFSCLRAGGGRP